MDRYDRIHQLHRLLQNRRTALPLADIQREMECSTATAKRVIATMRDQLHAPIVWDRDQGGYRYDRPADADAWQLPGIWFNAAELQALLALEQLLERVGSGLLGSELQPVRERVEKLLKGRQAGSGELYRRLRILGMNNRQVDERVFRAVAGATASRRRIRVCYRARSADGSATERHLSPQRLVHYRDNWYLDAWCHLRDGLRVFSIDRISTAEATTDAALDLPEDDLGAALGASYGIFQGPATSEAVLRFDPPMAQWVADEHWHARQEGQWLDDGRWELRLPLGNSTELVRDILRWGSDVEVLAPDSLRRQVAAELSRAAARYS